MQGKSGGDRDQDHEDARQGKSWGDRARLEVWKMVLVPRLQTSGSCRKKMADFAIFVKIQSGRQEAIGKYLGGIVAFEEPPPFNGKAAVAQSH
ncbi:hypothetical protein MRB53_002932 [Persea americana]|uniref:Uncharacterized protein n=1 Tax=Persea americana TaxID=3435 RepID=A0ACC2MW27_PERAE|nr:hypothetical protein MRB53_002932 [Persea americana]